MPRAADRGDERPDRGEADERGEPVPPNLHREAGDREPPARAAPAALGRAPGQFEPGTMSPCVAVRARSKRDATSDQCAMFQNAFT
ncbi:hypothetical protein GCM10023152_32420 [Agromyces bauzanensis]|uniref:Uncharacterized protein n=1 Tax=Agromyces bauzanensis TaxID=1308924 RepID=A0A917PB96_9MICO|nr:hypothetical protein GCM10011372_04370 [Agromyces bauzanensis]